MQARGDNHKRFPKNSKEREREREICDKTTFASDCPSSLCTTAPIDALWSGRIRLCCPVDPNPIGAAVGTVDGWSSSLLMVDGRARRRGEVSECV